MSQPVNEQNGNGQAGQQGAQQGGQQAGAGQTQGAQATETETTGKATTATETGAGEGRGGKDSILADLAKERDARQAAEQKNTDLLEQFKKALGLSSETDDPKVMAEQLKSSQSDAQGAKLQLAIYRSQTGKTADVDALLDSRSFQDQIGKVDPGNPAAVEAAVSAFLEQNPRFKLGEGEKPATGTARDLGQGNQSNGSSALTMDDLIRGRR